MPRLEIRVSTRPSPFSLLSSAPRKLGSLPLWSIKKSEPMSTFTGLRTVSGQDRNVTSALELYSTGFSTFGSWPRRAITASAKASQPTFSLLWMDLASKTSPVCMPSSSVQSHALWILAATSGRLIWMSIMMAPLSKPDGLAMPRPAISGAEPWMASNMAHWSPTLAEPHRPTEPATWAAISDMISPYKFSVTMISNFSG